MDIIEDEDICEMIITSFKNIDDPSPLTLCYSDGNNALATSVIGAVNTGNLNIFQQLILLYQDKKLLGELNNRGMNVLDIAREFQDEEIINLLKPFFNEED